MLIYIDDKTGGNYINLSRGIMRLLYERVEQIDESVLVPYLKLVLNYNAESPAYVIDLSKI